MKIAILSFFLMLTTAFCASAQNSIELPQTPLEPDMSTHFDRIMSTIAADMTDLFSIDVDASRLESSYEEEDLLSTIQDDLVAYAKSFIGSRYRRGGKGPSVFDCSGFTSFVFRYFGFNLFASSGSQSSQGEKVSLKDARVGDLIFFSGRRAGKRVGHVGMIIEVCDNGTIKFIHASTSKGVVIQSYPDGGYYSKRFICTRRIIG